MQEKVLDSVAKDHQVEPVVQSNEKRQHSQTKQLSLEVQGENGQRNSEHTGIPRTNGRLLIEQKGLIKSKSQITDKIPDEMPFQTQNLKQTIGVELLENDLVEEQPDDQNESNQVALQISNELKSIEAKQTHRRFNMKAFHNQSQGDDLNSYPEQQAEAEDFEKLTIKEDIGSRRSAKENYLSDNKLGSDDALSEDKPEPKEHPKTEPHVMS